MRALLTKIPSKKRTSKSWKVKVSKRYYKPTKTSKIKNQKVISAKKQVPKDRRKVATVERWNAQKVFDNINKKLEILKEKL